MLTTVLATLLISTAGPAAAPVKGARPAPPTRIVGLLTEETTRECLPGGKIRGINPRFVVGGVRFLPGKVAIPRRLINKLVVVTGRLQLAPPLPTPSKQHCPVMQEPVRYVPAGLKGPAAPAQDEVLDVTVITELKDLSVQRVGDKIKVKMRFPAELAVRELELKVKYRGCFGKPHDVQRTQKLAGTKVLAWREAEFPVITQDNQNPGSGHRFAAYALEAEATGTSGVRLKLSYGFSGSYGKFEVSCPR
jgi:hypothetical protein